MSNNEKKPVKKAQKKTTEQQKREQNSLHDFEVALKSTKHFNFSEYFNS